MNQRNKDLAKRELEKIYDQRFKWLEEGRKLQNKFSESLNENPILNLLLKLAIIANIGIWSVLAILALQFFN